MTLTTQRLVMNPIVAGDAEGIWPYVSDPEIGRYMSWNAHGSLEETKAFIADVERRMSDGTTVAWVVRERESGRVCGLVSLIAILRTHRALRYDKAELAYWIGRPFQQRGYATEACRAVLSFAFEDLKLNKLSVAHALENTASEELIAKLGFRRVGIEHKHFMKNGRWIDHAVYELLRSDWVPAQ